MQEKKEKTIHVYKGDIKNKDDLAVEEFNLTELPKENIINPALQDDDNFSDISAIIDGAVSSHLNNIVEKNITNFDDLTDFKIMPEITTAAQATTNENTTQPTPTSETKPTEQPASEDEKISDPKKISQDLIDTIKEKAKAEGVEEGLQQAKTEQEQINNHKAAEDEFYNTLKTALDKIDKRPDFSDEVIKITSEIVTRIANKLHLILETDFEKILQEALFDKLKGFYREGKISLEVHPNKLDFCKQFLQSTKIEGKFKDNIELISNETLGHDDCSIRVFDTTLEYNMENLASEIEHVLDQLANTK